MSENRPNVVVFFTDQQRWDTVGCYGCPLPLTPHLDALAARGTQFVNAFTCQPVCGPARASLQTGLYATATGCWRNGPPLPTDIPTVAKAFRAGDYDTGYIGKWHLAGTRTAPVPEPLRGGYEHWLASDVLEFTSHPYDGCVFDNDNKSVRLRGYRVDAVTDLAIDFVNRERRRPFFLFLSYLEPHFQNDMNHFVAPDGYAERYRDRPVPPDLAGHDGDWQAELPDYYGICARLDENLGRLRDALRACGKLENTIVLFTSDHGCHFRTRNGEYKRSCHESSIRIPLVIDGPLFRGGGQIEQLASLVDVPPTLLAACGLSLPNLHGRDLGALVRGDTSDWPPEVFVQISESHTGRALRTDRWKYSVRAPQMDAAGRPLVAAGSDLYVEDFLYDLAADPWEQNNLVSDPALADVRADLRARLIGRMTQAGERAPTIHRAP